MAYTSSGPLFSLYPFQNSQTAPHTLRLSFQKVRGMTPYGTAVHGPEVNGKSPWTATAFRMDFADEGGESDTAGEISGYVGGRPVMPLAGYSFTGIRDIPYIGPNALNAFELSADVPAELVGSPEDIALLPLHVRLRVPRRNISEEEWEALEKAKDVESVLTAFAATRTIWVRSPNALTKGPLNLLLADEGRARQGVHQAFTHENFLYIDFIVLAADAKNQQNDDKPAFCRVVQDGGIPYILLGDGKVDGVWTLSFYIDQAGSDSNDEQPDTPSGGGGSGDSGGGGGCSAGLLPFVFVLPALRFRKIKGFSRVRKGE
jgi:hypothetical protein